MNDRLEHLKATLARGIESTGINGGVWMFGDECQDLLDILNGLNDDACPRCGGETDIPGGICADCDANMLRSDMGV